ncbi:MAG: hypothetical protein AAF939_10770 [Planctomycetota bacterium]
MVDFRYKFKTFSLRVLIIVLLMMSVVFAIASSRIKRASIIGRIRRCGVGVYFAGDSRLGDYSFSNIQSVVLPHADEISSENLTKINILFSKIDPPVELEIGKGWDLSLIRRLSQIEKLTVTVEKDFSVSDIAFLANL